MTSANKSCLLGYLFQNLGGKEQEVRKAGSGQVRESEACWWWKGRGRYKGALVPVGRGGVQSGETGPFLQRHMGFMQLREVAESREVGGLGGYGHMGNHTLPNPARRSWWRT